MRLVGYIRVSRVGGREGDSFISPQQQRDRIEAHAAAHGHKIIGWQEDLDVSGARMERPGLEKAIAAVEHREADGVAVAKLDRFARSVSGAAKTLSRIEAAGGVLVAIDLGMDTSTPAGKLMRNVVMALAEFELDRIRENWQDAGQRAVRRGVHAARVPFGYQRGDKGLLEPHPRDAELVEQIFRMRADEHLSWRQIAEWLDSRSPHPNGAWPTQTVVHMIKRRTYLGETSFRGLTNTDAHPAIVDRDLWERAQVSTPQPLTMGSGSLLSGIARCAGCGYALSRRFDHRRTGNFYRCRGRHSAGVCASQAQIREADLDDHVTDRFLTKMATVATADSDLTVDVERAVVRLEQAEAELAAYRDEELVTVIGAAAYRRGLEVRAVAIDDARNQLAAARRTTSGVQGTADTGTLWPGFDNAERRELLAAAIDAVFVRRRHSAADPVDERIHICWAGEGPTDLPGRRNRVLRPFDFDR